MLEGGRVKAPIAAPYPHGTSPHVQNHCLRRNPNTATIGTEGLPPLLSHIRASHSLAIERAWVARRRIRAIISFIYMDRP